LLRFVVEEQTRCPCNLGSVFACFKAGLRLSGDLKTVYPIGSTRVLLH